MTQKVILSSCREPAPVGESSKDPFASGKWIRLKTPKRPVTFPWCVQEVVHCKGGPSNISRARLHKSPMQLAFNYLCDDTDHRPLCHQTFSFRVCGPNL